jgi:predicted amino acid racemase
LGRVNELRLGEAILLGIEPLSGRVLPGLFDDAFVLFAEVIESSRKTRDAPLSNEKLNTEQSLTNLNQAVLAVGTQDTDIHGLKPPTTMSVLGASSDHLVLNTGGTQLAIGSEVPFRMNYSAMSRLMNNPEVIKHAVN